MTPSVMMTLIVAGALVSVSALVAIFGTGSGATSNFESLCAAWTRRAEAKHEAAIEIERIKLKALEPYKDGAP